MRNHSKFIKSILCILIIFVVIHTAQAGVEPSPFKQMGNMVNMIKNRMVAIQHRLEMASIKLTDPESKNYKGAINQIENLEKETGAMLEVITEWRDIGSVPHGSDIYINLREAQSVADQWITTVDNIRPCLEWLPSEVGPILDSIQPHAQSIIDIIESML